MKSLEDFRSRYYRTTQATWLVSFCSAVFAVLPENMVENHVGWKVNLVTMETSMSSTISALYGYSSAGGIAVSVGGDELLAIFGYMPQGAFMLLPAPPYFPPQGGLLAEHILTTWGRQIVQEMAGIIGKEKAKALSGFGCMYGRRISTPPYRK